MIPSRSLSRRAACLSVPFVGDRAVPAPSGANAASSQLAPSVAPTVTKVSGPGCAAAGPCTAGGSRARHRLWRGGRPRFLARAGVAVLAGVAVSAGGQSGASPVGMRMSPAAALPRAAGAGSQLWAKRYDGPAVSETDRATAVAVSPDGGTVFITGGSGGPVVEDYATLAYDATTGTRLWAKRYNGPGKGSDQAAALAVSPDGSTVYVTGESYGGTSTSSDYATVAYQTNTGTQLWARRYNGRANGADAARALAVSADGTTVFVTGVIAGATSQADYATVAYNASTGTQLWAKRYDSGGNGYDQANAVAVSRTTGTVYVTGEGEGAGTGFDYVTVAYDPATGAQRWIKRYNDPGNNTEDATAVTTNPATGTVYVTGERYGGAATGFDYATIAYSGATGAALWVKRYDGPNHTTDQANAIAVSPDGGTLYVTGQSDTVAGSADNDYATLAYNAATGAQQWLQRYNGPGNGNDVAHAIAVDTTTGTVYVTGASAANLTSSGLDYATIAYRPTGTQSWTSRYNGTGRGNDTAYSIAVSPTTGAVYVTGESYGGTSTSSDYATIGYHR
jgi:PQQ-like domain